MIRITTSCEDKNQVHFDMSQLEARRLYAIISVAYQTGILPDVNDKLAKDIMEQITNLLD